MNEQMSTRMQASWMCAVSVTECLCCLQINSERRAMVLGEFVNGRMRWLILFPPFGRILPQTPVVSSADYVTFAAPFCFSPNL